jgi:AcrR family transcriptional regulator
VRTAILPDARKENVFYYSPVTTDGAGERGALAKSQAARRRRVIDATLALAGQGGFGAVQMRDVAAEAGVALGTVYRYFDNKERLLLEANVEQLEALAQRLRERPPSGATAVERVVEVLRRAVRALQRSPETTAAMVRALGSAQPSEADAVRRITQGFNRIITSAMHDGDPTAEELRVARVLSQVWFSSLIGWVGGVDPPEVVGDDLEAAARLLVT